MTAFFFFSSRRRHTRLTCDWSSDVCSSDLVTGTSRVGTTWLVLAVASTAAACRDTRPRSADATARPDSAYAAMQSRGKMVMGVNQYTSAHVFEDLPDGGRVVLDRDTSADTVGVA